MKVIVYHGGYCESGCCGHYVTLEDDLGDEIKREFTWEHPGFEYRKFAPDEKVKQFIVDMVTAALGPEHVADIDFDECLVVED